MGKLQEFLVQLEDIAIKNELRESSTLLSESQDFIYANRDELIKQYPNQWIAVYGKDIVGHDKDLLNLVHNLRASGAPLKYIALEMLSPEEIPLAL